MANFPQYFSVLENPCRSNAVRHLFSESLFIASYASFATLKHLRTWRGHCH
ncbi:MAG: hypothetical protein V6Z86_04865 [Hyphomicrobiales bacterium]